MHQTSPDVEAIFMAALDYEEREARSAYLDRVCGDGDVRRHVEHLLDLDARAGAFLESPAPAPTVSTGPPVLTEGPDTVIGPYKLLEAIGEGGMGTVYMAEQTDPVRRKVALKVIKPGMDTKQVVARFEAERQALALMDHPNIARVLDAGATETGRPYFVMELVRGIPITEYCDREQLSIPERLELFVLVCRAVQHAHQKGVIHRDLKPSNILVTLHDGVPVPKVIDFGIAKATGQSLTDRTLYTGFAQLVGTPLYMSPEQAEMSGLDVDTRSDVYSLGVLLYELLTGTTPFDQEMLRKAALDEMRRIIREEEPPKPSTRLSSLGETLTTVSVNRMANPRRLGKSMRGELDWVVMKALEKDRRRRYETANDFAADVMRYLTDRPVEACPPSARYRFMKYARRNRAALMTAGLVGLALVMGTVVSTWQATRATKAERQAAARYDQARLAVDEMYTEVAEKWLADQPRLTGLQKRFLEKALASYQRFAAEDGSDPKVRYEVIRALQRVGAIKRGLGQHAEAEKTLRRTVALAIDLAGKHPDRPEYRLVLAECRIKHAVLLRETRPGRPEAEFETEQAIQRAGRELEALRATTPSDAEWRQRLAESYDALCGELTLAHKLPEAEAAVQAASGVWQALVKDHPAEFEYRLGLAKNHSRRGMQLMWWGGQNEKAEAALRQAITLGSDLQAQNPGDPRLRYSLHGALANLGVILSWMKRDAEAEDLRRQALALSEGMAADFPDSVQYQEDLATDLGNLASTAVSLGRLDEAVQLRKRVLAIREQLVARHPGIPEYETRAIDDLWGLADALSRLGKAEDARQLLQKAVLRARSYRKAYPKESGVFVHALQELFLVEIQIGDHDAADRSLEEWAALYRSELADGFDGSSGLVTSLLRSVDEVAQDKSTSAQWREAKVRGGYLLFKAVTRELSQRTLISHKDPYVVADVLSTAPEEIRDPQLALRFAERAMELGSGSMAWQSLGWARYRSGDWKGCIEALEKTGGDPQNGDFFAAMAYWRLGDRAEARVMFDRADSWLKGYEERWHERTRKQGVVTHPEPWMLRPVRSEAAALLGAMPPEAGTESK